jgi:hypothetical protein
MAGDDGESRVFRPAGISYVRVPAKDNQASAAFYRDVFGWTVDAARPDPSFEDGSGHVIGHLVPDAAVSGEAGVRPYVYVTRFAAFSTTAARPSRRRMRKATCGWRRSRSSRQRDRALATRTGRLTASLLVSPEAVAYIGGGSEWSVSRRLICLGGLPERLRTAHSASPSEAERRRRTYATASPGIGTHAGRATECSRE